MASYNTQKRLRDQLDTEKTDAAIGNFFSRIKNYSSLTGRTAEDNMAPAQKKPKKMGEAVAADLPSTKKIGDVDTQQEMAGRLSDSKDEMPSRIGGKEAFQTPAYSEKDPTGQMGRAARTATPEAGPGSPATVLEKSEEATPPLNVDPRGVNIDPREMPRMGDKLGGGPVVLTNQFNTAGEALGDVAGMRERVQARKAQQGGSLRAGGLDVSFDSSVSPEAREAFMRQPSAPAPGGRTGGRLMGGADAGPYPRVTGPDPYGHKAKAAGGMPQLFTKETHPNMRYDEMETLNKQLIANAGSLGTRSLANQGLTDAARINSEGDLAQQELRNQGLAEVAGAKAEGQDDWEVKTVKGGVDDKGRSTGDQAVMFNPKTGQTVPMNTKFKALSPTFNPLNMSAEDKAVLDANPDLLEQVLAEYGLAGEEKDGLLTRAWGGLKDILF